MKHRIRKRLEDLGHVLDLVRRIVLGVLFWGFLIVFILSAIALRPVVRRDTLLVVAPKGNLVDSYTEPVTYRGIPVSEFPSETRLSDLVTSLDRASADRRIIGLWLNLNDLAGGGPASAGELAAAVERFARSGKKVIASADTYDNLRYRVAAPADMIVVDRLGEVFPAGYGYWRAYFGDGLERLGADARLFRSGESKTGAENFILPAMSETARSDESRLLGDLWSTWLTETAGRRDRQVSELADWIGNYDRHLLAAGGDASKAALDAGLVDGVESGGVLEKILTELFGASDRRMDALDYLNAAGPGSRGDGQIAVIPVSGTLVYGEGGSGLAGSRDVSDAIREARENPRTRALVLRINSPGGDVRAGEEIRRVLEETRIEWALPVVASLGDLAASGGYWIAVESDRIVTSPDTITGSIGVYSLSVSFEKALAQWLGIRFDGVGTTPWSGIGHPGRDLDDRTAILYEAGIADIDLQFRTLVSRRRGLSDVQVGELAGGIPWSGSEALANGLADELGGLTEAVGKAADLAGIRSWKVTHYARRTDPRTALIGRLLWGRDPHGSGSIR